MNYESANWNLDAVGIMGKSFFGFFGGFTVINRLVLLPRTAGLPLEVTAYFLGSRPDAECC